MISQNDDQMTAYSDTTLDDVLALQRDLADLCQDRPLVTAEHFRMNAYYGMDRILKRYAGLDSDYGLKVALPHGVVLGKSRVWPPLAQVDLPAVWCYPRYLRVVYERETNKKVILGASPFLYLMRMLPPAASVLRTGTIFFLTHSTRHLTAQIDAAEIVQQLRSLPPECHPISVCIYWKDLVDGRHRPFEQAGFRILSAGHMFDRDFLVRLYYLCSVHRFAASTQIGSHTCYALRAGCSFFLLDSAPAVYHGTARHLSDDLRPLSGRTEKAMRQLFRIPRSEPSRRQMVVADYLLGAGYLLEPAELRSTLLELERPDALGYIHPRPGKLPRLVVSPRLKRSFAKGRRVVHHLVQVASRWNGSRSDRTSSARPS